MSYCRWSSDGGLCDLYCYEGAEGFITHVARNRPVERLPDVDWRAPKAKLMAQIAAQQRANAATERKRIGGPHDGETFVDAEIADFRARLLSLRAAGYRFPDHVLETVDGEIADGVKEMMP